MLEPVERIGVVRDRQQFLAVVGAVDAGDVPVAGAGVVLDVGVASGRHWPKRVLKGSSSNTLPAVSQTRNWTFTVSATKPLPTAALVSGGKQPQFEPLKSMPSIVVPTVAPLGFWRYPSTPPCLGLPDCWVAVMSWAVARVLCGLGGEVGAAGDDQVELGTRIAGDLDVVGAVVRGHEVVQAGRVIGRAVS